MSREIILAEPRGFCAGVERALGMLDALLRDRGTPVYALHAIVHNERVVEGYIARGVVFVEELDDIPRGASVVFSAHGVSPLVEAKAKAMGLNVVDATCSLVKKVHAKAVEFSKAGMEVVLIGHPGHPEIIGTMGCLEGRGHVVETAEDAERLKLSPGRGGVACLTQTTLSPEDVENVLAVLRRRFNLAPSASGDDICYATRERQRAAKELARRCPVMVVVGSRASSNSNRLREVCAQAGAEAYLVGSAMDIPPGVLASDCRIGVTAGASTPEFVVSEVVERLRSGGRDK